MTSTATAAAARVPVVSVCSTPRARLPAAPAPRRAHSLRRPAAAAPALRAGCRTARGHARVSITTRAGSAEGDEGAGADAADDDEEEVGPSQVPRAEGVEDGEWSALDAQQVRRTLQDADDVYERSLPANGVRGAALSSKPPSDAASTSNASSSSSSTAEPFHLLGLTLGELKQFAADNGLPAFRGKQLRDHLYGANPAKTIDDLITLPQSVRAALTEAGVHVGRSTVHHVAQAADGTAKLLLRLGDDRVVEAVGIPADEGGKNRLTACVSSQVGCPMRCTFCATGKGGFARNLAPHEIVDQVISLEEHFGQRVTNVVFMGMGEPLLNIPNVLRAHEALNSEVGIGARHITISTVGVPRWGNAG